MDYLETCSRMKQSSLLWKKINALGNVHFFSTRLTFAILNHLALSSMKISFVLSVWEQNVIMTLCCAPRTPFSLNNLHPAAYRTISKLVPQWSYVHRRLNFVLIHLALSLAEIPTWNGVVLVCYLPDPQTQTDRPETETSPRLEKDTGARYNERVKKIRRSWSVRRRQHSLRIQI